MDAYVFQINLSKSPTSSVMKFAQTESQSETHFMAPPKEKDYSREHAESLDRQNDFRNFRSQFVIPTKADLRRKTLAKPCMFH